MLLRLLFALLLMCGPSLDAVTLENPKISSIYSSYRYSGINHYVIATDLFGESIQLEDGSIWACNPAYGFTVLGWRTTDAIWLIFNPSPNPYYPYALYNAMTGQWTDAVMKAGPYFNGYYTRVITGIDTFFGRVYLSDGSYWNIKSADCNALLAWRVGDAVIIGVNNASGSFFNPYFLLDVESGIWARADIY